MKGSIMFLALSVLSAHGGVYSQAMFASALTNASTSPDFLLVEVQGPDDQTTNTVCTTSTQFLWALHTEFDLDYALSARKRAMEIALNQPGRFFRFRKKAAFDGLVDHESPEALEEIRRLFAAKKDSELLDAGYIHSVVKNHWDYVHVSSDVYRDATARALLERGISCLVEDLTGQLTPHQ